VAAAMVKTGEADIAPYIDVQDANDPSMDVSYLNSETSRVDITLNTPPLDDIRVRTALNLGLDRQAFVGTIFSKDVQLASQLVLPLNLGYNADLKPWPYDPERAKALLAEAKSAGVPVDLPITLYGRTGFFPNTPDILTALAEMWKAIGLNVSTQMIERGQFSDLQKQRDLGPDVRKPAMFLDSHGNYSGDAGTTLSFAYHSKGTKSELRDPKLDALIDEGRAASGPERVQKFKEAFRMITQDFVTDVELFHMVGFARVSPKLSYKPTSLSNNELQIARIGFKN
jgi:peptide/nickel transport system substrate-binding protein